MSTAIGYALLGIGAGAIYALLGQGIVLIYRGSGVLNLAQGAFAMIGAYLYLELHAPGKLRLRDILDPERLARPAVIRGRGCGHRSAGPGHRPAAAAAGCARRHRSPG